MDIPDWNEHLDEKVVDTIAKFPNSPVARTCSKIMEAAERYIIKFATTQKTVDAVVAQVVSKCNTVYYG